MNRLLTTLLVWLLMAALPLHAVAATVNLSCAHAQQGAGAMPANAHAGHAGAGGEHAHHGGHGADAVEPAAADEASGSGSMLSHSSCSACSAFCVGAVAPPSASLPLPRFDGSEAVVITPGDFATGFIPEGLQRPPRPAST